LPQSGNSWYPDGTPTRILDFINITTAWVTRTFLWTSMPHRGIFVLPHRGMRSGAGVAGLPGVAQGVGTAWAAPMGAEATELLEGPQPDGEKER
jgi:hypothetical protein